MECSDSPQELREKITKLETDLKAMIGKLESSHTELEAHEGVLQFTMKDMRRVYEDLLRTQAQLLQADKLATIGLISAGIAHEINNLLASIEIVFMLLKVQSESLRGTLRGLDTVGQAAAGASLEKIDGYLKDGLEYAENMAKIAHDIKMFSRSDKGVFHPENINQVIDGVIRIVGNVLKGKAEIVRNYSDIPPVSCNAQQLSQVFLNLLVNASQAMEKKGLITIRTAAAGKYVKIEISDTGSGIPKEIMDKIFEPFFTTKDAERGTGLGLSISHEIIKKHNGTIEVQSQLGRGTQFTILLPA